LQNFRKIHALQRFKDELEEIKQTYERVSDFYGAATKALRTDPKKSGKFITNEGAYEGTEGIYMISMVGLYDNPPVLIFYEFDYLNVWLLSIKVSELDLDF
jgi:hypothetical protein